MQYALSCNRSLVRISGTESSLFRASEPFLDGHRWVGDTQDWSLSTSIPRLTKVVPGEKDGEGFQVLLCSRRRRRELTRRHPEIPRCRDVLGSMFLFKDHVGFLIECGLWRTGVRNQAPFGWGTPVQPDQGHIIALRAALFFWHFRPGISLNS